MNRIAAGLLAAVASGAEIEGGIAFRRALGQAVLDGSMASVERVDQLLAQIHFKLRPGLDAWERMPGAENFTLALAFYLGSVIAERGGMAVDWYTWEQARGVLPQQAQPPQVRWARVLGLAGDTVCVPLGAIEDRLFNDDVRMSCGAYVAELVERVLSRTAADENQQCSLYLDAFFHRGDLAGGLACMDELQRVQPDFSLESLARMDALLGHLRHGMHVDAATFINQPHLQNFVRWLGFYLGVTLARCGDLPLRWLAYAELRLHMPGLAYEFETSCACELGGRLYFPLGLVTEVLFAPPPTRSLQGFAADVLTRVAPQHAP